MSCCFELAECWWSDEEVCDCCTSPLGGGFYLFFIYETPNAISRVCVLNSRKPLAIDNLILVKRKHTLQVTTDGFNDEFQFS